LDDAQANLIGSLPLRMETHDGLAGYLLSTEYYGLGLDYLDRYPGLVRGVTREAMREAARAHMDPAGFSVAVAGPV
jgi:zinc protease